MVIKEEYHYILACLNNLFYQLFFFFFWAQKKKGGKKKGFFHQFLLQVLFKPFFFKVRFVGNCDSNSKKTGKEEDEAEQWQRYVVYFGGFHVVLEH